MGNNPDPKTTQEILRADPALADAYRIAAERQLHPEIELPEPEALEIPVLPESARLAESLGAEACKWLDDYITFSRLWSPRSYDYYHEAVGLFILSTIAARRTKTEFGGTRPTPLYILLTGRSSLYAKTTAAQVGLSTLRAAGLSHILAPDQTTPQKFVSLLATKLPDDYDSMTDLQQAATKDRLSLSGARGWFHEEFGSHVSAMMQPAGFMADFRGLLRKFDDCPESFESATIGRDSDFVERPYLALLGNLTPADLRKFAQKGSELWGDGFLARFAIVCPPADEERKTGRFPEGIRNIPQNLSNPLKEWHKRLGVATVVIAPPKEKKETEETESNNNRLQIIPAQTQTILMSREVIDRFYAYMDGLGELAHAMDNQDMDGNYMRFPEKALRIATLLASLSGDERIELKHWARAQAIAERWRAGLHALYESVNNDKTTARELEENVLRQVQKLGWPTPASVSRYIRGQSTSEIKIVLDNLVNAGVLETRQEGKTKKGTHYGFPAKDS